MKSNFRSLLRVIKELGFILNKEQKKRFVIVLIVILIGSGLELIGVSAILPFVQTVMTPEVIMNYPGLQSIIGKLQIQSSKDLLVLIGLGLILLYIIKNLYMIFSIYMQYTYSVRIQKELSIKALNSYMKRPYTFFLNTNSSEMIRGCSEDISGIYEILSAFFVAIAESVNMIMISVFLVYIEPIISFAVITLMIIVMMGMVLLFKPLMKRMGRKNIQAKQLRYKVLDQIFGGIKELFVMQRQEIFLDEYSSVSEDLRITQRNYGVIISIPDRIIEGICVSGLIGIVVIRLVMEGDMGSFIPKLGVFAMAAFKILPSVGKISSRMTTIVYNFPMLENVYNITQQADIYEKQKSGERKEKLLGIKIEEKLRFERELTIQHVKWQYEKQKHPVLEDINIQIKKGESIGLIGVSGAGKTTLADVILGLLQPLEGTICVDGIDVYAVPRLWSQMVAYVPQSVFLLDDTVRNNVSFGIQVKSDKEVWEALEEAQLKNFIKSLPDGLDTVVGERGVKFSGGQKQRIAIARALFHKPEILVLDEATAALDTETEDAVMKSIEALQGKITMLIVAHRLSTIRNCDKIFEIGEGIAVLRTKEDVFINEKEAK